MNSTLAMSKTSNGFVCNEQKEGNLILRFFIAGLLLCVMVLPTGVFAGVPFKHLFYFGSIFFLIVGWSRGRVVIEGRLLIFFIFSVAFTFFFVLVGLLNSNNSPGLVFKEAGGFFGALTTFIVVLISMESGAISRQRVFFWSFIGSLVFSLWKVTAVLLLVFGVLPYEVVYGFLVDQAGYRIVSSGIFGGLIRVNLIVYDFAVAFFLVLIIVSGKTFGFISPFLRRSFVLIGSLCVFFAFSRLLFALVLVASLWAFVFNIKFKGRIVVLFILFSVVLFSSEWLLGAYEQRFHSTGAEISDQNRGMQVGALLLELEKAPWIGNGFGAYSKEVIRDPLAPYSYEVQWVGFLAKLGLIGTMFLFYLVVLLFIRLLARPVLRFDYFLCVILLSFMIGGLTNQYLTSSASGIICLLHLIAKYINRDVMVLKNVDSDRIG